MGGREGVWAGADSAQAKNDLMAKLAGKAVEKELAGPDPTFAAYLLFGPDAGLIQERAIHLAGMVVDDLADPFRVTRLSGAELAKDPVRLADERAAGSLIGGRRVVWLDSAGDRNTAAVSAALDDDAPEAALLIVTADELQARSSLRKAFEGHKAAAAIGCYADGPEQLEALITATLGGAGVAIEPDAKAHLVTMLGADRMATRRELAKLIDYAGPNAGTLTAADVLAAMTDGNTQSLDALAYAVLGGNMAEMGRLFDRLMEQDVATVAILRACGRVFERGLTAHLLAANGMSLSDALGKLRPPVFFKDRPVFLRALGGRSVKGLMAAIARLQEAEAQVKSTGLPDAAVCEHALLAIAAAGGRRGS